MEFDVGSGMLLRRVSVPERTPIALDETGRYLAYSSRRGEVSRLDLVTSRTDRIATLPVRDGQPLRLTALARVPGRGNRWLLSAYVEGVGRPEYLLIDEGSVTARAEGEYFRAFHFLDSGEAIGIAMPGRENRIPPTALPNSGALYLLPQDFRGSPTLIHSMDYELSRWSCFGNTCYSSHGARVDLAIPRTPRSDRVLNFDPRGSYRYEAGGYDGATAEVFYTWWDFTASPQGYFLSRFRHASLLSATPQEVAVGRVLPLAHMVSPWSVLRVGSDQVVVVAEAEFTIIRDPRLVP